MAYRASTSLVGIGILGVNLGINKIPITRPFFVWGPWLVSMIFNLIKVCMHAKNQPHLTPFDLVCPVWPSLARFGPVWPCLAPFGPIWPRLTIFGSVKPHLDQFGIIWPHLTKFCPIWTHLAPFEPIIWYILQNCCPILINAELRPQTTCITFYTVT